MSMTELLKYYTFSNLEAVLFDSEYFGMHWKISANLEKIYLMPIWNI